MTDQYSTPCIDAFEVESLAGEVSQLMTRTYHEICNQQPRNALNLVREAEKTLLRQSELLTRITTKISADLAP